MAPLLRQLHCRLNWLLLFMFHHITFDSEEKNSELSLSLIYLGSEASTCVQAFGLDYGWAI